MYTEKSFNTTFNIGCGSVKSPMHERVSYRDTVSKKNRMVRAFKLEGHGFFWNSRSSFLVTNIYNSFTRLYEVILCAGFCKFYIYLLFISSIIVGHSVD